MPQYATFTQKGIANRKVTYAIKTGILVRPLACQDCSVKPDYRLHGHHEDYDQPLSVEWLCRKCHGLRHRGRAAAPKLRPPAPADYAKRRDERRDYRAFFIGHRGSIFAFSCELGIGPTNISKWLLGQTSSVRIEVAVEKFIANFRELIAPPRATKPQREFSNTEESLAILAEMLAVPECVSPGADCISMMDRPSILELLRKNHGISKQVASEAGVKPNMLSMWLHGRSPSRRLDAEVPGVVARLLSKQKPRQNAA